MRIGRADNFLLIEKCDPEDMHSPWRVEASAAASGQKYSAVHDRVMLDVSQNTLQQSAKFEALKTQFVEISLSEGGWLRLERDIKGYITVHYRLAGWSVRAVLKGEVVVEGEFAGGFCRELRALLRNTT